MLLKHNVPDKPRTSEDKTPLDLAIEKGFEDCIKTLRKVKQKSATTKRNEWLHDGEKIMTREIAQKILTNAKSEFGDGVFLVRRRGDNVYVLSVMTKDDFYNYEICFKEEGKYYFIDDGPYFRSLEHLIEHHFKFEDGLPLKLMHPISMNSVHCQSIMNNIQNKSLQEKTSVTTSAPIKQELMQKAHLNMQNLFKEVETKQKTKKKSSYKLKTIDENDIKLEAIIGEGEFGTVFKGTLEGTRQVAVKMMKDPRATGEFKREAQIMQQLGNHPCILRIFGVIADKEKFMMVQELMVCSMLEKLYEKPCTITEYNLKCWAVEIVSGMEHMEAKKIVHRDLAARNILLGSNLQAKISDFGLSRAYEGDEYTQSTDSKIPIKWYAPESIERCRFTSKSDVWSYGITLYEMWSYGDIPYGEKNGAEVFQFIQSGKRLDKPKSCSSKTYEIMRKCWEWHEEKRVSFKEIKELFQSDNEYEKLKSIYFETGQS